MTGSQAIETLIGLSLIFFVLATAASAITELVSRIFQIRARNLERTIGAMLAGGEHPALEAFKGTSIYRSVEAAAGSRFSDRVSGLRRPSYIAARSFADAITEMTDIVVVDNKLEVRYQSTEGLDRLPPVLKARLGRLIEETGNDLLAVKAGIESWFDSTMDRVAGAYKRWSQIALFVTGLILAIGANASAYHAAQALWTDPIVRSAVVETAAGVLDEQSPNGDASTRTEGATPADSDSPQVELSSAIADQLDAVAAAVDDLDEAQLPIGWTDEARAVWNDGMASKAAVIGGWVATALLVMLGAPFWFDLLGRLVSVRAAGPRPQPAPSDDASATSVLVRRND